MKYVYTGHSASQGFRMLEKNPALVVEVTESAVERHGDKLMAFEKAFIAAGLTPPEEWPEPVYDGGHGRWKMELS